MKGKESHTISLLITVMLSICVKGEESHTINTILLCPVVKVSTQELFLHLFVSLCVCVLHVQGFFIGYTQVGEEMSGTSLELLNTQTLLYFDSFSGSDLSCEVNLWLTNSMVLVYIHLSLNILGIKYDCRQCF